MKVNFCPFKSGTENFKRVTNFVEYYLIHEFMEWHWN